MNWNGLSRLISGTVATPANRPVNEVELRLSGEAQRNYVTNATGTYAFTELAEDSDYTVIPNKNDYADNGLSTFDVIIMQKHIVGTGPLTDPYLLIAADINRSGDITTLDLIQLRKMVLGVDSEFSNNTSWRFVDADYIFPQEPLSVPFPEVRNINNLEGEEEVNFVAIKIGDLNGSADAFVQPRSGESLSIKAKAEHRILEAGVDYRIDFSSDELGKIQGY